MCGRGPLPRETLNKAKFWNFETAGWLMTLQRPEKLRRAAWGDVSVWLDGRRLTAFFTVSTGLIHGFVSS
jgi:hypothetical protein